MNAKRRRGQRVALLAGALALSLPASAEVLRYAVEPGLEYQFEEQTSMLSDLTLSSGNQSTLVQQASMTRVLGTARVLAVKAGRPSQVVLSIDPASATQVNMNGQMRSIPAALAGRDVTVRMSGDSITSITDSDGTKLPLDEATITAVRPYALFDSVLLPARDVAIGDQWPARVDDKQAGVTTDLTLTLAALDHSGSLSIATLELFGTLQSVQAGSTVKGDIGGLMVVDLATGLPVAAYAKGDVEISGESVEAGQTVRVAGTGTLEIKRVIAYPGVPLGSAQLAVPGAPGAPSAGGQTDPGGFGQPDHGQGAAGAGDPRLVGMFNGESVYSGSTYSNTQLYWVFDGAGGVFYGAQTQWNAAARDYNQDLVWSAGGATGADGDRGRWQAADGILTIQWENGNVSRYAYGFEPDGALVLRNAQTRKLINFYSRVR